MNFALSGASIALTGSLRGVYIVNIVLILVNIALISRVDEHKYNKDFHTEEIKSGEVLENVN